MWTDCTREQVADTFRGKRVAIVGSGPGVLDNAKGFVDSHDVVVRINNFKTSRAAGYRTDVFYSYFGHAIRKSHADLAGVSLCMCKCPDAKPLASPWHERNGKQNGIDFRYIYTSRAAWWFCDTYIPTVEEFMRTFLALDGHIPTTGFSAIEAVLSFEPASVYLTGFDFFQSGVHNVDERWRPGDATDPIGHRPELERQWLQDWTGTFPLTLDSVAQSAMRGEVRSRMAPLPPTRRRLRIATA